MLRTEPAGRRTVSRGRSPVTGSDRRGRWLAAVVAWGLLGCLEGHAIAETLPDPFGNAGSAEPATASYLRPRTPCPQDLETLITGLLRDLPSYANRVARHSLGPAADETGYGTLLLAGRAEFEPLAIDPLSFSDEIVSDTAAPSENPYASNSTEDIYQVFFTTRERRYPVGDATAPMGLEGYHWLFLSPVADGWQLVLMFSRIQPDGATVRPPTPPQESSEGILGQAVRLWLRDCRAEAVYPIEDVDEVVPTSPSTSP